MRSFPRRILPLILVALASAVSTGPAMSFEPCLPPTSPENVIRNLERAYANRDIDAYAACLAPDYQFLFTGEAKTPVGWGREADVRQTGALFGSQEVRGIRIAFSPKGPDFKGSTAADGLIRVEVSHEMKVEMVRKNPDIQDLTINGTGVFFFQNVGAPGSEAHFVIARWEDPGTDSK